MVVVGLLIGESMAIFNPSSQARNDFMLMSMILLSGFSFVALAATLFVEKKVNDKLFSIKNSLLYLTKDNYFADKYLANQKSIREPFAEITYLLFQMKEYFVEYEESINKKCQTLSQREKMRALDHLSTSIAHEINNPLAGILGHAQLAKGKSDDPQLQKHLDIIEKEIRKVKIFTRDLMRFSKNMPLDCKNMNVNQVMIETIELMETQLKNKNIQVRKKLESVQEIYADDLQLQQVFVNLIDNAIHAMEDSQEKILTIRTEDIGNSLSIQVSDTGAGIPSNIRDRIFEPFFTTKKHKEGKGLGLSVCFGIVKGHKGNIHIESQVNRGSAFIIELPHPESLYSQKEQESILSEEKQQLVSQNQIEDTQPVMSNKKTVDIANPFQAHKIPMTDLQGKLKDTEAPKANPSKIEDLKVASSSEHSPIAPSFQTQPEVNEQNDTTMIHKETKQTKSMPGIDIQLEKDIINKKSSDEKVNFFVDKRAILNKKRVDFKVKIRAPKIKEQ